MLPDAAGFLAMPVVDVEAAGFLAMPVVDVEAAGFLIFLLEMSWFCSSRTFCTTRAAASDCHTGSCGKFQWQTTKPLS